MDTNTNTDTNTNLPNTLALSSQYFLEKSFLFPLHFIVLQGNCDPNCTSRVQKVNPGDLRMIFLSIYQTSAYPFSCTLIGYSSLEYPVISTDLHNKMDAHTRNHFFQLSFDWWNYFFCHWLFTGLVHTKTLFTCISICRGLSINFSTKSRSSPKLEAASWEDKRNPSLQNNNNNNNNKIANINKQI